MNTASKGALNDDVLDNLFELFQPLLNKASRTKISSRSSDSLYFCGFSSCCDREGFKSQKAAKEHYRRFHKDDLIDFSSNNMEPPSIIIKGGPPKKSSNSSSTKISTRSIPVVRQKELLEDDPDDGEWLASDDESDEAEDNEEIIKNLPPKKRGRSTKKSIAAPTAKKGKRSTADDDELLGNPEYAAALKQAEKVRNSTMRKKTLSAKKVEMDELHGELHREEKIEELDEVLEEEKRQAANKQHFLEISVEQLLVSATTIINVQKDPVQRKESIKQFVVGAHVDFGHTQERFNRQKFIREGTAAIAYLTAALEVHDSNVKERREKLQTLKTTFINAWDGFHKDEQTLLDYAERIDGDDLRRALNFAQIYEELLVLNFVLKLPQNIAKSLIKEVLQERVDTARTLELNKK